MIDLSQAQHMCHGMNNHEYVHVHPVHIIYIIINVGLPPSSAGLPLSCDGPPPSSVLLPPCCVVWSGTRKRRHQGGIIALWDGRPTLWDGSPTLCEGRPALRDAIGRPGALSDGRPTLWDGISVSLPPASEGLHPSNVLVSRLYTACMPCMRDCNDQSGR